VGAVYEDPRLLIYYDEPPHTTELRTTERFRADGSRRAESSRTAPSRRHEYNRSDTMQARSTYSHADERALGRTVPAHHGDAGAESSGSATWK